MKNAVFVLGILLIVNLSTVLCAYPLIEGHYKLESSDKFEDYLQAIGVSWYLRVVSRVVKPTTTITYDEATKEFKILTESTFKNTEIKFKDGEEFDETTADGRSCKSKIKLENDHTLLHRQNCGKGQEDLTQIRKFTKSGMAILFQAPGIEARRIYARA